MLPRADRRCKQMQAALITPDDVGTDFDQTITAVDPEVDYLCYSQPSADRSAATEVDEQLFGPDGATEIAVVTLSFPDAASAATYLSTTESFLTDNARSGCNLTQQPTDALESSTTLDDSFTFTFDGGNGRSQATWAKLGNTVVVVIGNPLAAVPVDDLVVAAGQQAERCGARHRLAGVQDRDKADPDASR